MLVLFLMQEFDNPAFWRKLSSAITPVLPNWDANRVASVVGNIGRVAELSPELLDSAANIVTTRAAELNPASLADMLLAVAHAGYNNQALVAALCEAAVPRLHSFDSKSLSLFAEATARLGALNEGRSKAVAAAAVAQVHNFSAFFACKLARSLSTARFKDVEFYNTMASSILGQVDPANQHMASLVSKTFAPWKSDGNAPKVAQLLKQVAQ